MCPGCQENECQENKWRETKLSGKWMSGQSSARKMLCWVDVSSGKCVQEFEPEPF